MAEQTRDELVAFEKDVARRYEAGEIKAPVHLSGGNEKHLIDIFKNVYGDDWVLSTWRSHYHALLKGVPPDELMRQILLGKSMSVNSPEHRFYASSIAGGILPVAVGLGMAVKRKSESRGVWCFVGDMVALSGIFRECTRYAFNFNLPVRFVVEDNGKSVQTPTDLAWGTQTQVWRGSEEFPPNVLWYRYELTWPHHGVGKYVAF